MVVVAHRYILLDNLVNVELFVGNLLVEVGCNLKAHALDEVHHGAFVELNLSVFEPSFQQFLGVDGVFGDGVFKCQLYFSLRPWGFNDVYPFLLGRLVALSNHFHLVARLQFGSERNVLAIDFAAHTLIS